MGDYSHCKLNDAQRAFIIHRLAAYEDPVSIKASLKQQFGIDISLTAIYYYGPSRRQRPRWKQLYTTARARIDADQGELAARIMRARMLTMAAGQARVEGHERLAQQLEQQAERELDMRRPVPQPAAPASSVAGATDAPPDTRAFSDEQRLRAIAALITKVKAENGLVDAPAAQPVTQGAGDAE